MTRIHETKNRGAGGDLLQVIRLRRDSMWLAGRDPQGVAPTRPEESSTWVVTQIEPVLMAQPATGGVAVSVEVTDSIKGVRVGHRIRVEVRGMGSRVATSLLDQLPIKARDAGEDVAKINGKTITVGGSTVLSADDVGALPGDTTLADLGYTGTSNHTHSLAGGSCQVALPSVSTPTRPASSSSYSTWQEWVDAFRDGSMEGIRSAISDLSGAQCTCNGCVTASQTGSNGGSGGTPTPTNPGERSIVVAVSDPGWFDPGSPGTWSWTWGADVWTLTKRAASTLRSLSGKTLTATGATGSITLRTISPIDTSDPVPWEEYSQVWGDQVGYTIGQCYNAYSQIVGSYSVSGGGSVTIGPSTPSNPIQSAPVTFNQPYAASVRLSLSRLYTALQGLCGTSFPY